ncbi:TRIC cation channel family protein [Alloacidobacterium dinghuense]|uniref:TRIC cation channel family protein n=1 Tax=Alloacidobacterium dinghuense TaxID=2763107 RepID=A0A7G8BFE9_9BACT|nr:TRIC cation channel family protein [Alloacidobacterium dinghuense]QNI31269.1 TRIC cation channel family protein [Alloacidobacterium dinghuense]
MIPEKRLPVTFHSATLLLAIDLIGTFVFAVEGSMAAVQSNLDILGLMVLAFATALGGGIIRDVLIGAIPPNSICNWRYPAAAFAGGAIVFFQSSFVNKVPESLITTLDAAGLALFAAAGAAKALDFNIHPFLATLMGGITGVGGGTIRDVLLARIPSVLRADVYAAAALAGAAAMILALRLRARPAVATTIGIAVCFTLRMAAVHRHWNLPKVAGH